jgi:antiviral helicase SKI2
MLYKGADIIRDVEWVIFDEVHYVNDLDVCPPFRVTRHTLHLYLYTYLYLYLDLYRSQCPLSAGWCGRR